MLKILAREKEKEKERKGMQVGKEEFKLSLFENNMILYLKYPMDSPEKSAICRFPTQYSLKKCVPRTKPTQRDEGLSSESI